MKKLTLLHSNDMHGDFLTEEIDEKLVGGVSMLSGYINKVRSEEKNVIYAIAGDMFRGSVIDTEFKGISTIEIMNALAPDIVTLGNHEIDYGVAHVLFIEKCAHFPIINANLFITTNRARLFSPYKIMRIDGMNILFIGIITKEVLAAAKQDPLIGSLIDTSEAAEEVGRICNAHRRIDIDFTVLLTHIGIEEDIKLAKMLKPEWGVDLIIGGHSHTYHDEPAIVNDIVIAHAGTGTDHIGRFDIVIDTDKNAIDSFEWNLVSIDESHCPRDVQLEEIIEEYKGITDKKYARILTRFRQVLKHPQRNMETPLGNLFADIFKESLGLDMMFLGSGSIRSTSLGAIVDYGDLTEAFPYDDSIYMVKVKGAHVRRMLRHILRDDAFLGTTEFYQLSRGMKLAYSKRRREFESLSYMNKEIQDGDVFTLGLQEFHFNNFEDFLGVKLEEVETMQKPRVVSTSSLDILEEYLNEHSMLHRGIEGRIRVFD